MVTVVLDAMGGDHAPQSVIAGALESVARGIVVESELALVGPADVVREQLLAQGAVPERFTIVDAPDSLGCDESPIEAMRRKPKNSITVGIQLLREGKADAYVSAGSTGGVVAAATMMLGCLEGVRRPGIAVVIEGEKGPFIVIDVGANPQPKPAHLLHYALMGAAYCEDALGKKSPRVGLLNIGTEEAKGNPLTKETVQMLRAAPIQFVGNVEGVDVFRGVCDVIVSDGFTGNVLLKVSEGVAEYMLRTMGRFMAEVGIATEHRDGVVAKFLPRVDYSEYGGALLLGVNGSVTICHGRSHAPAIRNAIRFAVKAVRADVNQHIRSAVKAVSPSPRGIQE